MQLLIQRGQRKTLILRRPLSKLWVKFELTPEETALVIQYKAEKMILVAGGLPGQFKLFLTLAAGGLFRLSLYLALIPALYVYFSIHNVFAAIQYWLVAVPLIYSQIREQVKVRDVLIGRNFSCKSVLI